MINELHNNDDAYALQRVVITASRVTLLAPTDAIDAKLDTDSTLSIPSVKVRTGIGTLIP